LPIQVSKIQENMRHTILHISILLFAPLLYGCSGTAVCDWNDAKTLAELDVEDLTDEFLNSTSVECFFCLYIRQQAQEGAKCFPDYSEATPCKQSDLDILEVSNLNQCGKLLLEDQIECAYGILDGLESEDCALCLSLIAAEPLISSGDLTVEGVELPTPQELAACSLGGTSTSESGRNALLAMVTVIIISVTFFASC